MTKNYEFQVFHIKETVLGIKLATVIGTIAGLEGRNKSNFDFSQIYGDGPQDLSDQLFQWGAGIEPDMVAKLQIHLCYLPGIQKEENRGGATSDGNEIVIKNPVNVDDDPGQLTELLDTILLDWCQEMYGDQDLNPRDIYTVDFV